MKHILLTGGRGFLGSHLKSALSELGQLYFPTSQELNLLDSTSVKQFLKQYQIDFIVHSAARGVRITSDATVEQVMQPNLDMFKNLAQSGINMLTIGSGAEYDKRNDLHKVKENDFGRSVPIDPYGLSKYKISQMIAQYDHIFNLRLFGVYGAGESPTRLPTYIVTQILKNQPIVLRQNCVFDFLYIDDFVRIVKHFVQNHPSEKFINLTPTQSIELLTLAQNTVKWLNAKVPISVQHPGMNKEYTGDNTLLLQLLGDFKFTDFQTGMTHLYNALKENYELTR